MSKWINDVMNVMWLFKICLVTNDYVKVYMNKHNCSSLNEILTRVKYFENGNGMLMK